MYKFNRNNTAMSTLSTCAAKVNIRVKNVKKRYVLHYVHSSLIYNSQKLERTQMPFNRGMDTENVVHLHNAILISYQKQCLYKIHRQMVGTGKYHPE